MDAAIFGVLDHRNIHHDVSLTERGAKLYATKNGFEQVTKRVGYNAYVIARKIKGKWQKIHYTSEYASSN